jgi:hypothetical protein
MQYVATINRDPYHGHRRPIRDGLAAVPISLLALTRAKLAWTSTCDEIDTYSNEMFTQKQQKNEQLVRTS